MNEHFYSHQRRSITFRSITLWRGIHKQKFSHYDKVPHEVTEKIVAEYEKSKHGEEYHYSFF